MEINLDKTKVVWIGGTKDMVVELEGQELEQVTEFVYLGSAMTETATSER